MNQSALPVVDNKTVFGSNYQKVVGGELLPIGSNWVCVYPPSLNSGTFDVWTYRIKAHSEYASRIGGPAVGIANTLEPVERWQFYPSTYVSFMGKSWPLPPRDLIPFLPQDYLDLFLVIDAGLIQVPEEYRKPSPDIIQIEKI